MSDNPRDWDPKKDPASSIVAVAVSDTHGGRDVLFVVTELGYVYRIVSGGPPKRVFEPIRLSTEGRMEP